MKNYLGVPQPEKWLTLGETAKFLKVSKSFLYARTSAGAIPFHKVGGHLRFCPDELTAWLLQKERIKQKGGML